MGRVVEVVKRIVRSEDSASIAADIAEVKSEGAALEDEAEQLEAAQAAAETFEASQQFERQIAAVRWRANKAADRLKNLHTRLAHAKAQELAEDEARIVLRHRAIYGRYRTALQQLGVIHQEAVQLDREARGRLGEGRAGLVVPPVHYAGLIAPDYIAMWVEHNDKLFAQVDT